MVRKFFLNAARAVFAVSIIVFITALFWIFLDVAATLWDSLSNKTDWSAIDFVLMGFLGLVGSCVIGSLAYDG